MSFISQIYKSLDIEEGRYNSLAYILSNLPQLSYIEFKKYAALWHIVDTSPQLHKACNGSHVIIAILGTYLQEYPHFNIISTAKWTTTILDALHYHMEYECVVEGIIEWLWIIAQNNNKTKKGSIISSIEEERIDSMLDRYFGKAQINKYKQLLIDKGIFIYEYSIYYWSCEYMRQLIMSTNYSVISCKRVEVGCLLSNLSLIH